MIVEICNVIQKRRLSFHFSVYELSQRSGVSQQAISYYEKLHRRPNLECLAKISKALELDLSELISIAEKNITEASSIKG